MKQELNQNNMTDETYEKLSGVRDLVFAIVVGGMLLGIAIFILMF